MLKNLAYKFRIYPNKTQEELFKKSIKCSNFIYNYFLEEQIAIDNLLTMYGYTKTDKKELKQKLAQIDKDRRLINKDKEKIKRKKDELIFENNSLYFDENEASIQLTYMSNNTHTFLQEIDSTIRTSALKNLKKAFQNITKIQSGYPKFKNRNSSKSFTGQIMYNGTTEPKSFKILKNNFNKFCHINIPKIKNLKCVIHNEDFKLYWNNAEYIKINSYTISQNTKGEWYISLSCENKKYTQPIQHLITPETTLGIDIGVKRPITTSDINDFDNQLFSKPFNDLKTINKEIDALKSVLSNKKNNNPKWKTSNKCKRINDKILKLQNKLIRKREYYQHNITSELVNKENINCFVIENLNVVNMTKKSHVNIKQKSGLNKSLLNIGINSLYTKLIYKADSLGKSVKTINPKNTSITCSCCGHINKKNRTTQSNFICKKCGHIDNADFNAGKNIKNKYFENLVI